MNNNEVVMNLDKYVSVKYAKTMKTLAKVDHCRVKLELPAAETGHQSNWCQSYHIYSKHCLINQ